MIIIPVKQHISYIAKRGFDWHKRSSYRKQQSNTKQNKISNTYQKLNKIFKKSNKEKNIEG